MYRHCSRIDKEDKDHFEIVSENVLFSSNVVELVRCSIISIAILQVSLQRRKKKFVDNDYNNGDSKNLKVLFCTLGFSNLDEFSN